MSVIVPSYNYGKYLEQCLLSVEQSDIIPGTVELIIVDDASTDNTLQIADRFKNDHPDIQCNIIKNDVNLGLIRSRNRGIANARGFYLFFLDADNYIARDCLRNHLACMYKNPDSIACYSRIQYFSDKTGIHSGVVSSGVFSYEQLLSGPYIDAMGMFRRDALIRLGMYDSQMPPYGWEDYELWLRIGKAGENVTFIEGPALSYYRLHENNMGKLVQQDRYNQILYYLKTKYPIQLKFSKTEQLTEIQENDMKLAQMFYLTDEESAFTEVNSITIPSDKPILKFTLPLKTNFKKFRFDPVNDFAKIALKEIIFKKSDESVHPEIIVTSNAIYQFQNIFWFNTKDPQLYINLPDGVAIHIDEVQIILDILETGDAALVQLCTLLKQQLKD